MSRRADFAAGAFAIAPVLAAAIPIALLFGTLSVAKGLSVAETSLMSMTVFAGALQFVAIDQWSNPVPVGLLAFTALVVNIRHVLMGASIGRSMGDFSSPQKYAGMFFLTDESWAFAEQRARKGSLTPAFYFGSGVALWSVWNIARWPEPCWGQGWAIRRPTGSTLPSRPCSSPFSPGSGAIGAPVPCCWPAEPCRRW
jgi:predicted branched-subunit amino acid permease